MLQKGYALAHCVNLSGTAWWYSLGARKPAPFWVAGAQASLNDQADGVDGSRRGGPSYFRTLHKHERELFIASPSPQVSSQSITSFLSLLHSHTYPEQISKSVTVPNV